MEKEDDVAVEEIIEDAQVEPDAEDVEMTDDVTDEIEISIGEESEEENTREEAPKWVKDLRKKSRSQEKEIREYKRQLAEKDNVSVADKKPMLSDFEYDEEKFEKSLIEWNNGNIKREQSRNHERQAALDDEQAWNGTLSKYEESKKNLKVSDFQEAEENVIELLSPEKRGMIIAGSKKPELLIYALGRNEKMLQRLSEIKNNVNFIWEIAQIEKDMKVKPRKVKTAPEKMVSGTAPKTGTFDSTLEKLRDEAVKSGDLSKVTAYKRKNKYK